MKENLHDVEVADYLDRLEAHLQEWLQEHSGSELADEIASLTIRDIEALEILTQDDVAIVRFVAGHPEVRDGGYQFFLDLRYRGNRIIEFEIIEVMP